MPRKTKSKIINIHWEKAVCDNCGSKKNEIFLDNVTTWEHEYKFREVKCSKCRLVYLSPRPKNASISYFYSSKTYWGTDVTSNNKKPIDFKKRKHQYGRVYKNILNKYTKGSIFDAGFGTGLFLSFFKEMGWNIDGVELSNDAVEYAKKVYRLNNLRPGRIESFKITNKLFDVITFNSSLEHLYSPKKALKKACGMLKNNGILIITVPNLNCLGFKIFKKKWLGLHPPKHLYHFNEKSLSRLLKNTGFSITKTDHWNWNHSFYSLFQSFRYSTSPRFKIKHVSIEENSEKVFENKWYKNITGLIIKETGIIFALFFASLFSVMGSLIKRGEIITVYAKKN